MFWRFRKSSPSYDKTLFNPPMSKTLPPCMKVACLPFSAVLKSCIVCQIDMRVLTLDCKKLLCMAWVVALALCLLLARPRRGFVDVPG